MSGIFVSLVLVFSIVLIHFAYVDFRFRYRDGMKWFWVLHPAPMLMWLGRGLVVAAVLFALCLPVIGGTKTFFVILAALMAAHLVSLILLEVLEPR